MEFFKYCVASGHVDDRESEGFILFVFVRVSVKVNCIENIRGI